MDSFDHLATADLTEKWTSMNGVTIGAAAGRRGSGGLVGNGADHYAAKGIAASSSTIIMGAAVTNTNPVGTIWRLMMIGESGGTHVQLYFTSDGKVNVGRMAGTGWDYGGTPTLLCESAAGLVTTGVTYYVEWLVLIADAPGGSVAVRVNGLEVASATGVDTRNGGTGVPTVIYLGSFTTFDDLYVSDGAGAAPGNTFLGDCRVDACRPTAAGATTGWTPSTGANWQCVDDATPNDDTDYTSATAAGVTDTFVVENAPAVGATIFGVQHCLSAKKTDAGAATLAPVVRQSGVDYVGTDLSPSTTYATLLQIQATNPGTGAAWTEAGFNAAEFGYRRTG